MKKIVVPTDFSANAMKAITYSAEIARRMGASIYLLHIIEPLTDKIHQPYPLQERLQEEIAGARLSEMNTLKEKLAEVYPDLTIESELAKGTVTTAILDYAESLQADIIIMGTQGASGLKEVFLGSISGGTIGRTKIPVLAVPFEYLMEEPDAILFATNRFEKDRQLLDKIVELASPFNAAVHTVVFMDIDTCTADSYIYNHKQLNQYLDFLKQAYPDISFTGELLEGKGFEETLEEYDKKHEVDIIAMITYPKSFGEKLLKKSVTKKMTFHSKIPVLAIPAK